MNISDPVDRAKECLSTSIFREPENVKNAVKNYLEYRTIADVVTAILHFIVCAFVLVYIIFSRVTGHRMSRFQLTYFWILFTVGLIAGVAEIIQPDGSFDAFSY